MENDEVISTDNKELHIKWRDASLHKIEYSYARLIHIKHIVWTNPISQGYPLSILIFSKSLDLQTLAQLIRSNKMNPICLI